METRVTEEQLVYTRKGENHCRIEEWMKVIANETNL